MIDGGTIISPKNQTIHTPIQVILNAETIIIIPNVPTTNVDHTNGNTFHCNNGTCVNLGNIEHWKVNAIDNQNSLVDTERMRARNRNGTFFNNSHRTNTHLVTPDE